MRRGDYPAAAFFHVRGGMARLRPFASAGADGRDPALFGRLASPQNDEPGGWCPLFHRNCRRIVPFFRSLDAPRRNRDCHCPDLDILWPAGKADHHDYAGHFRRRTGDDWARSLVR